jgi:hypothetical protein
MRGSLGGNRTAAQDGRPACSLTAISVLPTLVVLTFTAPVGEFGQSHSCATHLRASLPLGVYLRPSGHVVSSLLSDLETRLWPVQAC